MIHIEPHHRQRTNHSAEQGCIGEIAINQHDTERGMANGKISPLFIVVHTGMMTGFAISSHQTVDRTIAIPEGYEPVSAVYQRVNSSYPSGLVTCSLVQYPDNWAISIHNGSNDYMTDSVKYAFDIYCIKTVG